jgi:hypothetical protein
MGFVAQSLGAGTTMLDDREVSAGCCRFADLRERAVATTEVLRVERVGR